VLKWILGALSVGVKRLGLEIDDLLPSSVKVKVELYLYSHIRLYGVMGNEA
jgi:hypothetical protein